VNKCYAVFVKLLLWRGIVFDRELYIPKVNRYLFTINYRRNRVYVMLEVYVDHNHCSVSNSQVTSRKADASGGTPSPLVGRHVYQPASFL